MRLLGRSMIWATCIALPLASSTALGDVSPYAGQETRGLKSLDSERIRGLKSGAGLGYAKAAELNGWPGPLHALELAEKLQLTEGQRRKISAVRAAMSRDAKSLGRQLIDAERQLDNLFVSGTPAAPEVGRITARISAIEAQLRARHLVAHVETRPILTEAQRRLYKHLRGYHGGVREGHSGQRRHAH